MKLLTLLFTLLTLIYSQCPEYIQDPCSCTSTRYEAVSIVCDKAESLSAALLAIGHASFIDSLVISATPIDHIPPYAFQGYHVKKLIMRNNGLRTIDEDAFTGTLEEVLEELEIRGNYIDTIPQTGIPKLKNLKVLSLSDNIIEYVPDNSFLTYYSRDRIERLDLSSNNMTTIHPTGFLGLEKLGQLSLDKNQFQRVPTEALANVQSLEDLSLGVNMLTTVPPESIPLPNLKSLSLEVNQIRSIPADSFQSTPMLTYLYLGNNLLTSVDAATFFYINGLKVLSMGNNKDITAISSNALQNLPQLLRLELSDCSIANIDSGVFQKTQKLQAITLARNHLTHISHDIFSNNPSVATIDLSGNSITHVDDFSFSQLSSLTTLDLSGNRLESLPINALYESIPLKGPAVQRAIYLHNNPWRCDKDLQWLRKWLRENGDVIISTLGGQNARCWSPANLNGLDLRQTDPVKPKVELQSSNVGDQMRRLIRPSTLVYPQQRKEIVEEKPHNKIEGANLLLIILGCVVGVIVICLILLLVIKLFVKTSPRKENHSSNFSSSSMSSGFASTAYSGADMLGDRLQRSATNQNVLLNRPRYWWF